MQWIKDFLISCAAIAVFLFAWMLSVQIGDFAWVLKSYGSEWYAVLIGLAIAAVGGAALLLPERFKIIGAGICLGAAIGLIFTITHAFTTLFEDTRGFWRCVGVWFIYMFLITAASSAAVAAAKNIFFSVLRFDFVVTLLALPVCISCAFAAIDILVSAFQISAGVGIPLLLGLLGGGAAVGAPTIGSGEFLPDGFGGRHYSAGNSDNVHTVDTDGNTLRQRADGNYEKLN